MRRVLALLVFGLAACGGGGGSGLTAPPSGLTPALVNGVWDMVTTGCHNDNLAVRLSASDDGTLTSAVNTWGSTSTIDRPLDGVVHFSTGAAEFHMWSAAAHVSAVLFVGTLTTNGTLAGTLTDPMPGYEPIFHFMGDADCVAQASGRRR